MSWILYYSINVLYILDETFFLMITLVLVECTRMKMLTIVQFTKKKKKNFRVRLSTVILIKQVLKELPHSRFFPVPFTSSLSSLSPNH